MRTNNGYPRLIVYSLYLSALLLTSSAAAAFQSDELLVDDEEFGLEGGRSPVPELTVSTAPPSPVRPELIRRRSADLDSDSKVQFQLEHAFGDSDFSPAGIFTARLKTWSHGGQSLTKLRFSRDDFSDTDKKKFKKLLEDDDFYRIRVPSNILSPPGRDYVISSVKARCLPRDRLDEHFVINMDGANILAVNYGSPGACPYPRQLKLPTKWSFNSYAILKTSEQAPRTPAFTEEILGVGNVDGEEVKPPERSFWAKYWMYAIPLGLMVMNAITQAMNMPPEGQAAPGQAGPQGQPMPAAAAQRGQTAAVRRR